MTTFHYPRPESSADMASVWGELSSEAQAALASIAMGPNPAGRLLVKHPIDGGIGYNSVPGLSREAQYWAHGELEGEDGALLVWQSYQDLLDSEAPGTLAELAQINPNLGPTLERLHQAKQALMSSGEVTPDNENIGDVMRLVLMPWQTMCNRLDLLEHWVNQINQKHATFNQNSWIDHNIKHAMRDDLPMYRDEHMPATLLSAENYMARRMAIDGPFGVMLVQMSRSAGVKSMVVNDRSRTIDEMTNYGKDHIELAGQSVDAMGVLEWCCTALQADTSWLAGQQYALAPANRLSAAGATCIPIVSGRSTSISITVGLVPIDRTLSSLPRLAVM